MNHILPKNIEGVSYLSYSQISMWLSSPTSYRKRYYDGGAGINTDATQFGKKIATALEQTEVSDSKLQKIERYDTPEFPIKIDFDGFMVIGYIDSFDSKTLRFREYKTGQRTKSGKAPWNISKVYSHLQLPIYSLAIQEMFGKVEDVCHLDWMETKKVAGKIMYKGHALLSSKAKLELTGHVETFARTITQKERDDTRDLIIKVAKEIHDDYKLYR